MLVYSPVFNPLTRAAAIAGAAIMHLSFILFMRVGLFPYICLIYLVLLVPDEWWLPLADKRRMLVGQSWSRLITRFLPSQTESSQPARLTALCLVMTVVMIQYSFMTLPQAGAYPPRWLSNTAEIMQVEQQWEYFRARPGSVSEEPFS